MLVLELDRGVHREVAHAAGEQEVQVAAPYPLALVPSALLD